MLCVLIYQSIKKVYSLCSTIEITMYTPDCKLQRSWRTTQHLSSFAAGYNRVTVVECWMELMCMPRTKGKLTKINIKPLQSQITTHGCSCNTLHVFFTVCTWHFTSSDCGVSGHSYTRLSFRWYGDFFSHNDQLSECTCTPWYDNRPL